MGLTVIGVFTNSSAAMKATEQLIHLGFLPTNIEHVFQSGTPISEDVLITDQPTSENSLPAEPLVAKSELGECISRISSKRWIAAMKTLIN